jgi:hypothetical protein
MPYIIHKVSNPAKLAKRITAETGRATGSYSDHEAMDLAYQAKDPMATIFPFVLEGGIVTIERLHKDTQIDGSLDDYIPRLIHEMVGRSGEFAGT